MKQEAVLDGPLGYLRGNHGPRNFRGFHVGSHREGFGMRLGQGGKITTPRYIFVGRG